MANHLFNPTGGAGFISGRGIRHDRHSFFGENTVHTRVLEMGFELIPDFFVESGTLFNDKL
jgi:hypothetical protein